MTGPKTVGRSDGCIGYEILRDQLKINTTSITNIITKHPINN